MRFSLLAVVVALGCTTQTPRPPAPDAIGGIVDAFRDHSVVAIGETHRSVELHRFLRRLIADPRFIATVDDIVIEFGNERYQPVLDRYISGGDVSDADLQHVWRDTTQLLVWDSPLYRELLDTVRAANRHAPAGRQLRVLAGDPPIDWSQVRTSADYDRFAARDPDTARIIEDNVLKRHRRALLVIGGAHVFKRDPLAVARGGKDSEGAVELVLAQRPASVFVVWPLFGPAPGPQMTEGELVRVAGTPLGARSFGVLSPGEVTILRVENGKRVPHTIAPADYPPVSTVVDAVLWLGATNTEAPAPPSTYVDPAYVETLRFRARILTEMFGVDFISIVDEAVRFGAR